MPYVSREVEGELQNADNAGLRFVAAIPSRFRQESDTIWVTKVVCVFRR